MPVPAFLSLTVVPWLECTECDLHSAICILSLTTFEGPKKGFWCRHFLIYQIAFTSSIVLWKGISNISVLSFSIQGGGNLLVSVVISNSRVIFAEAAQCLHLLMVISCVPFYCIQIIRSCSMFFRCFIWAMGFLLPIRYLQFTNLQSKLNYLSDTMSSKKLHKCPIKKLNHKQSDKLNSTGASVQYHNSMNLSHFWRKSPGKKLFLHLFLISGFNHPLPDMGKHSLEILTTELPSVQQFLLRLVLVLSLPGAAMYSTESSWHTCLLSHDEGDWSLLLFPDSV